MVTCPKCHFVQPPDRFCANCGVDMERYRARSSKPIWQKIVGSYLFQAAVIVGIVMLTSFGIYKKKQRDIERITQMEDQYQEQASKQVAQNPLPQPPPPPPPKPQPLAATTPAIDLAKAPAAVPEEKSKRETEEASAIDAKIPTLKINFTEVSSTLVSRLNAESRPVGAVGTINVSILPGLDRRLAEARDSQELLPLKEEESHSVAIGEKVLINETVTDPVLNKPVGIQIYLNPTQIDRNGLHVEMDLTRSIREVQNGYPSRAVQPDHETVVIRDKAGVVILGTLPHRKLLPGEDDAFSSSVLRIMTFPDFQNSATEFAIFILGEGLP